ncbi:MAG: helix-turn-helix domain-containing protein [Ruminiclostridium sp.]|nr:helix-turn-helix domain-containing protein [Ruminiclostridium sp.]
MQKEHDDSIDFINEESPYNVKEDAPERTTMSVPEMRRLLGLGKTESYWLVHRNRFKTILVNGKMRIDLESFEEWYSMQTKHKKVDGPPPGEKLKAQSLSTDDIAELLDIHPATAIEIIRRYHLEYFLYGNNQFRVTREVFDNWYASQTRYRTKEDRERDADIEGDTISMPEMARLLGISRSSVYSILYHPKNEGVFRFVTVADRRRVTKESFMEWLGSQTKHHILSDAERRELDKAKEKDAEPEEKLREPKNPNFYTIEEVTEFFGIHRTTVYKWIQDGTITAMKVGRSWRIQREEFDDWLDFRSC